MEAHLTRLGPAAIALLDAGTSNQARAVHVAHRRGQVEAIVLIAAERAGVPVTRVTHAAVKKRFDVAPTKPALRSRVRTCWASLLRQTGHTEPRPLQPRWSLRDPPMSDHLVAEGTLTLPYGVVRTLHYGGGEVRLYRNLITQTRQVGKRISRLGREGTLAATEATMLREITTRMSRTSTTLPRSQDPTRRSRSSR